jgi:hypothetical protein
MVRPPHEYRALSYHLSNVCYTQALLYATAMSPCPKLMSLLAATVACTPVAYLTITQCSSAPPFMLPGK